MRTLSVLCTAVMVTALIGCSNYVLKSDYDRDVGQLKAANDALVAQNAELEPLAAKGRVANLTDATKVYSEEVLKELARRFREAGGGDFVIEAGSGRIKISEMGKEEGEALFETGKAVVTEKFKKVLKAVADECKKTKDVLMIVGHTDGTRISRPETKKENPSGMNLELGARRATAVADALHDLGIPEERMVTMSYGRSDPEVTPEKTNSDKARNRRVEIFFVAPRK